MVPIVAQDFNFGLDSQKPVSEFLLDFLDVLIKNFDQSFCIVLSKFDFHEISDHLFWLKFTLIHFKYQTFQNLRSINKLKEFLGFLLWLPCSDVPVYHHGTVDSKLVPFGRTCVIDNISASKFDVYLFNTKIFHIWTQIFSGVYLYDVGFDIVDPMFNWILFFVWILLLNIKIQQLFVKA